MRGGGSRYRAALLRDPQLIEFMATKALPKKAPPPPLEEFDPIRAELANMQDILWRILYATLRADPKGAPTAARPEMPWEARQNELLSAKSEWIRRQMVPWEVN